MPMCVPKMHSPMNTAATPNVEARMARRCDLVQMPASGLKWLFHRMNELVFPGVDALPPLAYDSMYACHPNVWWRMRRARWYNGASSV